MARRSKNQTQKQQPCYFCGGKNLATTRDHVPPRACFPDGFAPEGFDFPACKACNESSVKYDQIFGFYAMALDFDESNTSRPEDIAKLLKLKQGILNNYAGALPDPTTAVPVYDEGAVHTLSPKAVSVETTDELKAAIQSIGQKLAHALYLKDTGKFLTTEHQYLASVYQPQVQGTDVLTDYFNTMLPMSTVGVRRNIKNYGNRFRYMSGYMADQDFFVYTAQFGQGLILWGIVRGPLVEKPSVGPLAEATWQRGASGDLEGNV